MFDLSRLNAKERQILLLLAQGHTAKSAAVATGSSVHAVNERLREARRKTGVASSRELARLVSLNPQKSRDEKIGVPDAKPASLKEQRRFYRKDWLTMTALALASTTLALVLLAPQSRPAVAPKVNSVSPAAGATVAPGTVTIRVRFDQPMRGDGWSFVRAAGGETPACAGTPRRLADGRSFELECRVEPGRSYALGFNGGSFWNFRGVNGLPAEAAVLRFRTRR